jgi:hypothetical protein
LEEHTGWLGTWEPRFAVFSEVIWIGLAPDLSMAKRIVASLWPESPTRRTTVDELSGHPGKV